jgi:hypothetical protein
MTDCPNAEIRDRLPDLLHDRLDASTRAAVMAHVEGCEDCREELELLRGVRKAIVAGTPRVNISEIVYALPKPGASLQQSTIRRMPRVDWRLAAAVTLLVAGASSLTVLSRNGSRSASPIVDTSALTVAPQIAPSVVAAASTESTTKAPATAIPPKSVAAISQAPASTEAVASVDEPVDGASTAQLSGLNSRQLKALLNDIDQMQAVPVSDPEPVAIRVDAKPIPSGPDGQ